MDYETGSRLASLRKEFGYSQESLAQELGLSRQAISKWERGESAPDTDNLIALSNLYGVSIDDLLHKNIEELARKKNEKVLISITGDEEKSLNVRLPKTGSGEAINKPLSDKLLKFPFFVIVIVAFLLLGLFGNLWHPSWVLFLLIPSYYLVALACRMTGKKAFMLLMPLPLIVTIVFLFAGFIFGIWKYAWLVYTLLPLYYWHVLTTAKKD